MKKYAFFAIALLCSVIGIIFFLIQRNWLIIQFTGAPASSTRAMIGKPNVNSQKTVRLYYWKNDKWHHDDVDIIWNDHQDAHNTKQLIKQWLSLMQDEHIITPSVVLQAVSFSSSGSQIYVSFDQSIFSKDWSITKKWQIFEGLCKTLYYSQSKIQAIRLLVNHQTLDDDHLDFSQMLPVIERS